MSVGIIITMAVITVGSAVTEKILEAAGKNQAAQYMNLATISGLAGTALTIFAGAIKALRLLG